MRYSRFACVCAMRDIDSVSSSMLSTSPCLWKFLHLREIWQFGFRSADISNFLGSIPMILWPTFKKVLSLMEEKYYQPKTNKLTKISGSDSDCFQYLMEAAMWEDQNECGFIQFDFDPETGDRTKISTNDFMACLWGMTKQDLLYRLSVHSMPLIVPGVDLLYLMVDDILHEFRDSERYLRLFTSFDPPSRAILVHWSTRRNFNAYGGCHMVAGPHLSMDGF